jgi:hypothetical protein
VVPTHVFPLDPQAPLDETLLGVGEDVDVVVGNLEVEASIDIWPEQDDLQDVEGVHGDTCKYIATDSSVKNFGYCNAADGDNVGILSCNKWADARCKKVSAYTTCGPGKSARQLLYFTWNQ